MQIVDMDVGRVVDGNFTAFVEVPSTGGIGMLIIALGVNKGACHVGRVVVGNRDHGSPTMLVWMTNSNYWMKPISTTAGMLRNRKYRHDTLQTIRVSKDYIPFLVGNGRAAP